MYSLTGVHIETGNGSEVVEYEDYEPTVVLTEHQDV